MSAPAGESDAPLWLVVFTLAARELARFFRQRHRVIGALGQPIIFWLLFSEGLRASELGYEFFFPGTLAMILLFTAIFATISIIEDRREGFLQGVLVAPVPLLGIVGGKVVGGAAIACCQGLLFLLLGVLTLGMTATAAGLVQALLLMLAMSVWLTALGSALAWRMDSSQGFHAVMSVFLFPMWLLSGAFFPKGKEGWLGWAVDLNPLTYGVAGLRQLLEFPGGDSPVEATPLWLCWLVTLGAIAVTLALAAAAARRRTQGDLL